ncbi:hypothetical protein QJ857_gp1186 [Tupanvirus soda lake]|uniref:Gamma-soluble NSF attachment protein n=2 Tax=Tupanvirus TaxID=2094720 RepID=A0A6N1NIZ0_9VIRU|nr:hypothetical protein QJ857_gp1186 [Tupanvirus soda lake]QKU34869.1 hypothetical protein [Tupanvirus soda lake]
MNNNNCKVKADDALDNALKLYKKSKKSGLLFNFIYGTSHKNDLCHNAIDFLNIAVANYRFSKIFDKYIECLILKAKIEGELNDGNCVYTLLDIGKYYTQNDTYDSIKALKYYNMALDYCFETNSDKIYIIFNKIISLYENESDHNKVVEICETFLSQYEHLLKENEIEKVYEKMADKCFLIGKYDKASFYFDKCAIIVNNKKYGAYLAEKFFHKSILSTLANDDYVGAKIKYNRYCEISATFSISKSGRLYSSILESIEQISEMNYTNVIKKYDYICRFQPDEINAFNYIKNINFQNENHLMNNNHTEIDIT